MTTKRAPIIAVNMVKGGVGKSTTVSCLAAGLALFHNRKVLVIETDSQASVCLQFGMGVGTERYPKAGVVDFLLGQKKARECIAPLFAPPPKSSSKGAAYIMAGGDRLIELEEEIVNGVDINVAAKIHALANAGVFDVILIDTPPSYHRLIEEVIMASDGLILPVCPNDHECKVNLSRAYTQWRRIRDRYDKSPDLIGVVMTLANVRTRVGRDSAIIIKNAYEKANLYLGLVRHDSKIVESHTVGVNIFTYRAYCNAALDYRRVVDRVELWVRKFARRTTNETTNENKKEKAAA